MKTKKEMVEEFEDMTAMAELRALSNFSLEKPLTDNQYDRMQQLARKLGLGGY